MNAVKPVKPSTIRLDFPGLTRPIHLRDAEPVANALQVGLSGWRPSVQAADASDNPASATHRRGGAYVVQSTYLDEPMDGLTVTGAFCAIVADLSEIWSEEHPKDLMLHAGGVVIAGQVVAFAGEARAGKSTLMARLTAEAWAQVLCDDVLPVQPDGQCLGLGIPPRLRLPLPKAVSARFRQHVQDNAPLRDGQYAYLAAETTAPHGTKAAMGAFVALTRLESGPARFHDLPKVQAMAHVLTRNISLSDETDPFLERAQNLVEGAVCLRLVYSDLEEAVALIRQAFCDGLIDIGPAMDLPPAPVLSPVALSDSWAQMAQVRLRQRGAETYLWHPQENSVLAVNPIAAVVWQLLSESQTGDAIAKTLAEAFPQVTPATIRADVALLLAQFEAAGVIRRR
ncbi:PqqD family peptide modification chaperone [Neogemmobacter tilapiae]|uniref:PqqD family peptide modification chaperone n=1 Tax=Neogemmobacter tilapiae TaxID=875041 RepID=A0A918TR44_9RHOB|nr:PqqD family protein [Gemmobacter tilapiae]GHC59452.1 hypothetical protein GCM10007315_23970 [Gemmobacter tilapiae]